MTMKRAYLLGSIFVLSLAFTERATADIVYDVNRAVGIGSVMGFIQTDGIIGTVNTPDIVDWNLVLNDGTGTANLLGPLSGNNSTVFISDGNLTATPTLLQFNFNGNGGFMNFFTCTPAEWSLETTGSGIGCNGTTGNEEGVLAVGPGTYSLRSGEVTIGTAATVPEPSTWGVTLIVFGLLVSMRNRSAKNLA